MKAFSHLPRFLFTAVLVLGPLAGVLYVLSSRAAGLSSYAGMSDASAVATLDRDLFVVADDELTLLRVYSRTQPGRPVHSLHLAPFLGLPPRGAEVDLEGAARIGSRLYWISSHACNASGQPQPSRQRFFATTGRNGPEGLDLRPVGRAYGRLLDDLIRDPRYAAFHLAEAAKRIPKTPGALNIEGLAATPEGHLLIGFRNPIPDGLALIAPLLNPAEVVDEGRPARFGDPIRLALDGLGIRSIELRGDRYWIVAGAFDGSKESRFYQWTGGREPAMRLELPEVADLNPEAITFFNEIDGDSLWVVSDDGTVMVGGKEAKKQKNPYQRRFRAMAIRLQPSFTAVR